MRFWHMAYVRRFDQAYRLTSASGGEGKEGSKDGSEELTQNLTTLSGQVLKDRKERLSLVEEVTTKCMTIEHKLINDQLNLQGKVKDSHSYESVMLHLVLNLSLSNASVQPSSTARKRFRFFFNWNIFVLSSSLCVCVVRKIEDRK